MKKLLSPSMIVALIALFVALSGTAVATTSALIGSAQIKNNSVTGLDVKNKSLTAKDFRGSVRGARGLPGTPGQQGPKGDKGDRGDKGDKGDKGDTGTPGAANPNAVNSDKLDDIDSSGFVQGEGKTYVGRVVVPTSTPVPDETVLIVPGFATLRTENCQAGGANASLVDFDQTRGTLTGWRDPGVADPEFTSNPGVSTWYSNFQLAERTTWHFSVGTGANAEVALIDVFTAVDGTNCIYSATAHVWGR